LAVQQGGGGAASAVGGWQVVGGVRGGGAVGEWKRKSSVVTTREEEGRAGGRKEEGRARQHPHARKRVEAGSGNRKLGQLLMKPRWNLKFNRKAKLGITTLRVVLYYDCSYVLVIVLCLGLPASGTSGQQWITCFD
jgi:hypothetical protein